ncbi:MAG: 3-dehydroquinate synthase [Firmicutes bacterium]|nr:3-dehydroquinate synthase [Bacillota bacterium]
MTKSTTQKLNSGQIFKSDFSQLKQLLCGNFVVVSQTVFDLYPSLFDNSITLKTDGEGGKNLKGLSKIIDWFLSKNLSRDSLVFAVGGGATLDLVGFACAVYMRGINWIAVPTTALSVADSGVGGKTAINFNNKKNILGSFHSPQKIILCNEFFVSLSKSQIADGLAEIIKTALLDQDLLDTLDKIAYKDIDQIKADTLFDLAVKSAHVKEKIVLQDFFDKGKRQCLNMGHTIGHAIEAAYQLSHGQSVAIGLVLESQIYTKKNLYIKKWLKDKLNPILDFSKIKISDLDPQKIANLAMFDKKNSNEKITIMAIDDSKKIEKIQFLLDELSQSLEAVITIAN